MVFIVVLVHVIEIDGGPIVALLGADFDAELTSIALHAQGPAAQGEDQRSRKGQEARGFTHRSRI